MQLQTASKKEYRDGRAGDRVMQFFVAPISHGHSWTVPTRRANNCRHIIAHSAPFLADTVWWSHSRATASPRWRSHMPSETCMHDCSLHTYFEAQKATSSARRPRSLPKPRRIRGHKPTKNQWADPPEKGTLVTLYYQYIAHASTNILWTGICGCMGTATAREQIAYSTPLRRKTDRLL